MSQSLKALNDFLAQHCDVKHLPIGPQGRKERCYVLSTEDCLLFMAETHVQEIRDIIDQTEEVVAAAKASEDFSNVVMSYNWDAPEPGMNSLRIPVKLVDSLDDKRALMILRNLEGIQKDIDEGRTRREELQALFGDTAKIRSSSNLDGERIYIIVGKKSASDRRRYAERYAEVVATNVLFKLPKALNARLQKLVPKEARGFFFLEGRDITSSKIRYGADAQPELTLTDEGALVYTRLTKKNAKMADAVSKLFQQAMLDPFGLSLKYYMGKHAIIKLASSKEEK
jgi:hypothetical protein